MVLLKRDNVLDLEFCSTTYDIKPNALMQKNPNRGRYLLITITSQAIEKTPAK